MRKKLHCSARFGEIKMRLLKAAAEMPASTEREVFLRLPTVPNLQKKAEIANILFNIMSEQRAKRGYKCRKGIAAFW